MNLASIIVLALLALGVGGVIAHLIKRKGRPSCGCGCEGCTQDCRSGRQ
ncbi:MAG: FeoB-associated Cys-rich membrane protein [Bacteroidales bacterium]|nr:FeoB-associated Cys-rich membrane protein [Bacteroidales bacterium]